MNTTDEDILRSRFAEEFEPIGGFEIRSAPTDSVIRQGRTIRTRRRAAFGGGLLALAAVAVGVPALSGSSAPAQQAAARVLRHHVTVDQIGPGVMAGEVGAGSIDGKNWTMSLTTASATEGPASQQCFQFTFGSAAGPLDCATPASGPDPVGFAGTSGSDEPISELGTVRSDVGRVEVDLADGEALSILPTVYNGQAYVGFALPQGLGITQLTAFTAHGALIAYSIPYNPAHGIASFITWYLPGQAPTQADVSGQIASGRLNGATWSVDVALGPFGECFSATGLSDGNSGPDCNALSTPPVSQLPNVWLSSSGPTVVVGELNARVDHLIAALSNGQSIRLEPVTIGGRHFGALVVGSGIRVLSLTSYDSAGHQLGQQTE